MTRCLPGFVHAYRGALLMTRLCRQSKICFENCVGPKAGLGSELLRDLMAARLKCPWSTTGGQRKQSLAIGGDKPGPPFTATIGAQPAFRVQVRYQSTPLAAAQPRR